MRRLDLVDTTGLPDPRYRGEQILLLVTQGSADDWGEFEPLRGTTWAEGVELISAEALSHALHHYYMPLLRELGRDPRASAKRVSEAEGACNERSFCPTWDKAKCRPSADMPRCYMPPLAQGTSPQVVTLFRTVAESWQEGRHTIVAVGKGFNIA